VNIPEFDWSYKQIKFPHLAGQGTAMATLTDCFITLSFSIKSRGVKSVPRLVVSSFDVQMQNFSLKVSSDKASWVYNLLTKLFSTKIKNMVRTQILEVLSNSISSLTVNINELGGLVGKTS